MYASLALLISLSGCTRVSSGDILLPDELFNVALPKTNQINSNKDASVFMVELFNALQDCRLKLDTIKQTISNLKGE